MPEVVVSLSSAVSLGDGMGSAVTRPPVAHGSANGRLGLLSGMA
jgi:hypothetical protein